MTTPGPRDARVVLSAETGKYVTSMNNAAAATEKAAGRMVSALGGVAAAWDRVAASAKAAGSVTPRVTSAAGGGTTSRSARGGGADAIEASQRRLDNAIAAADRKHEATVQRIMNAEQGAQNRINNSRITGAREAAKIMQAQIAVADAERTKAISAAQVAERQRRVATAKESLRQATVSVQNIADDGRVGTPDYRDAVNRQRESIKDLRAEQTMLGASESAYTANKAKLTQQQIKLSAAERIAAEQTAAAEVAANNKKIASSKAAQAAATRAAQAEQGRLFYSAGRDITSFDDLGRAATRFGVAALAGFGIAAYAAGKWENEFANVERVTRRNADGTKASAEQVAALGMELRKVATITPASLSELTEVATAAGQLGVAREFVTRFTQSAVQLGVVTNLSAEQAATGIAKLIAQTGDGANQIQKIGSTLVALGNAGASTESQILAMSVRFAGAGRIAGLSVDEILALSSSMASVGIQAELGGSSMQRFLFKVYGAARLGGQSLNNFAKVAGTSADEFRRMFDDKPIAAIMHLVGGLRQIQDAGGNAVSTLQQLGFYNVRDQRVIAALAASYGQLTKNVELAAEAYEQNTALVDAYNIKAEKTAQQLKIQKNRINDAAITLGTVLLPIVERAATSVANLANMFASIPSPIRDTLVQVGALVALLSLLGGKYILIAASVGRLNRAVVQLTAAQRLQATAAGTAAAASGAAAATGAAGAGLAGGAAAGGLLAKLKGGAGSLGGIASKLKGGPAGVAVLSAVLIGLAVANSQFGESSDEAAKKTAGLAAAMKYFAQTGQVAGQAAAVLGPNMERLQAALAGGDKNAWSEIDAGLTELVNTGEDKAAQIMFAAIADQAKAAGKSVEFLSGVLPGYTVAQTAAAQAAADQAAELDSLAQELENYDAIINRVQTQLFGKERVARDIRSAWADLREEMKKGGATLDEVRDAVAKSVTSEFAAINATNDYEQSMQSLREAIKGTAGETEDATDAMDLFSEAIEKALSGSFDSQDAMDAVHDTFDDIKKRVAEAAGNGFKFDFSAQGDSASARQNRDDIQELLREEARLFEMDVKLGKDPAKALKDRREEFAYNLREIGYYDEDIREALAKFSKLPSSIPEAAAAVSAGTDKLRRPTLTGGSADAIANRQDIPDLVSSTAAHIAQNLRLGMSQKQVQAVIANGKAELTSYLRSLGFSGREIRPYVARLDSIADGYKTATKESGNFRESMDSQKAALEKLSALYSAAVGEFANEGLRTPQEIIKQTQAQADMFEQVGRNLGYSREELSKFKAGIIEAGNEFAGVQAQISGTTLKPKTDTSSLNKLKGDYDAAKQGIQSNPVTVGFTAQNKWLQWAFDGIALLSSWARKNPIYLVFNAIGGAIGGTAGSVMKGAAAGAGLGAMAGTVIPGVGNLLGAVIGGVAGGALAYVAKADGGWINGPGGPREDRVPAMLSAGEFVVNARSARRHSRLLEGINGGGSSPYTAGMQMSSFASSLNRAEPSQSAPQVHVSAPGISASELAALVNNRPVVLQLDGKEIARYLGGEANRRTRTR